MTILEIVQLVIGSGGLLGLLGTVFFLVFRTGKIVEKINFIGKEVSDLRGEMKSDMSSLRSELKSDVSTLRAEMKSDILMLKNELKSEISQVGGELLIFKKEVKEEFEKLHVDVSDIKERVTFMEAFIFFSEFTTEGNNARSDAAKKMWERRKMKKVEIKGK
jgi:Sec-independent protein translocase protein TatA